MASPEAADKKDQKRTVTFFDEDNNITIDDSFDTTDFYFYPEKKNFEVHQSIKDDVFYNNQTIEYKISADPIELWVRTLESSSEPPLEYSIKDRVVLESEVRKNSFRTEETIAGLKREVEWRKAPILANYEINLYILSKHPEIISKDDYRRFLRQSLERIKLGLLKVDEAIKADTHGLTVQRGGYGKTLWYPVNDLDKEEYEIYSKLPEAEKEKSKYGKKLKHAQDSIEALFTESSPKYVGVSEAEFRSSDDLLAYLEKLLDGKDNAQKKTEVVNTNTNAAPKKSSKGRWIVVIVISVIALAWGVWTAIGVFLLGAIIIGILSSS